MGGAHHDTLLSGEVRRITEQLVLRHGQQTRQLSDQHGVVETVVAGSRRDQVPALEAQEGEEPCLLQVLQ